MLMDRKAIIDALDKVETNEPNPVKKSGYADQLAYLANAFSADVLNMGNERDESQRKYVVANKKFIVCLEQLSERINEVDRLREGILKLQKANENLIQTTNNQRLMIVGQDERIDEDTKIIVNLRRRNRNQATRINRKGKK